MKILLVDDDKVLRIVYFEMLESFGHKVVLAEDGEHGFDLYKADVFGLVITDYSMPKMDGIEMSKKIKENNPKQKICMISGYTANSIEDDILPYVDYFLMKPVFTDQFLKIIKGV